MTTMKLTKMKTECLICGKDEQWHRENNPAHAFSLDGRLTRAQRQPDAKPVSQERPRIQGGGDPVLRMALIRKGIITPEDLTQVEDELNATGISHT